MKFGLIARADDRGIGIQTWEVARNLRPDRVLIVMMAEEQQRYVKPDIARYTELGLRVVVVPADRMGDADAVAPWCSGLDVIYSVETFYDWRFCDIARSVEARTVLHVNPEFWSHWADPRRPWPDVLWSPTAWMHDHPHLPECKVVPMPCPVDRWPEPRREPNDPISVLHIVGHQAMADRNGTRIVFDAVKRMESKIRLTVTTQRERLWHPELGRNVEYRPVVGNIENYWSLYEGHDVLVMPRRFGGLCLPAIEACGAGLAVVMPRCAPNQMWPVIAVDAVRQSSVEVPLGNIGLWRANDRALARTLDWLASDTDALAKEQAWSRAWAESHSWTAYEPAWRAALEAAAQE